jgi:hypothetical protein
MMIIIHCFKQTSELSDKGKKLTLSDLKKRKKYENNQPQCVLCASIFVLTENNSAI